MQITEIKTRLPLSQVLKHYHLKPDKNLRLHCPFHDDKTPSLQVYYKTHTAYCFSTNCPTHGKSMDVIDFIMHKEKVSKHEAILKAKALIGGVAVKEKPGGELAKIAVLTKVFTYFKNGVHNSKPAKAYLEKRGLNPLVTEVGYNSGQFHHGKRKEEDLIKSCIKYGLLLDLGTKSRTGNPAYKPFGKWCLAFALRNANHQISGLYFRSTLEKKAQRHFYLKDRQGLYPHYPPEHTRRLILTESIIDAATLLQQEGIKGKYAVLALYGTNGFTAEHEQAIREWLSPPILYPSSDGASSSLGSLGRKSHLGSCEHELIFFLNGDEPGRQAVKKYAPMLKGDYPKLKVSQVLVPENEDANSLLLGHSADILEHLINTRTPYEYIPNDPSLFLQPRLTGSTEESTEKKKVKPEVVKGLDTNNPYNIQYQGQKARYQIKGFKLQQVDSLKITLKIIKTD